MSKGQESLTRTESKRREQRKQKSKVDKILNILIAIVSILIVLNVLTIFNDNDTEKELSKAAVERQSEKDKKAIADTNKTDSKSEKNVVSAQELDIEETASEANLIVQASNDPMVEEVIVNPQWDVTPTTQTGEHVSAYEKGHPDYEEKLETFRQAVQLAQDDVIFWSVKNNGSTGSSVAVLSSNDKTENYRVYIEWVENEGWIPVKVEKLNQTVGAS